MTMTTTLTPPDRLGINVQVEGGKTVSKFVVKKRGIVTFYNQGTDELTLLFKNEAGREESPFCKGKNKPEENPLRIKQGDSRTLTICEGIAGRWFKYAARIGKADEEDPIFFVE